VRVCACRSTAWTAAGLVIVATLSTFLSGTAGASGTSGSPAVIIGNVAFTGTTASPAVTVNGTGFGSQPQSYSAAVTSCGAYGLGNGDLFGTNLNFVDVTNNWAAGKGTDQTNGSSIGIVVAEWTSTKIVFRFGVAYDSFSTWYITSGDSFTLTIQGTPLSGTAFFSGPPHLSSLQPARGQSGTVVTATGTGFIPGATSVAFEHAALIGPSHVSVNPTRTTATFTIGGIDEWTWFWGGRLFMSLITPGGESNQLIFTALPHPVTYLPPTPDSGPSAGGTRVTVTLHGYMDPPSGFDVEGAVVGGKRVTAPVNLTLIHDGAGTQQWTLTFTTPPHTPGRVHVTLISYVPLAGPVPTFTYLAKAPISAPSPAGPSLPDTGPGSLTAFSALLAVALLIVGVELLSWARPRRNALPPPASAD
jgi:hypothetical protein